MAAPIPGQSFVRRSGDAEPSPRKRRRKKFPRKLAARIAFGCLVGGPAALGIALAIDDPKERNRLIAGLAELGLLATVIGVAFLFVLVFAMIDELLSRDQRGYQLFYRLVMLFIGTGLVALAVFAASEKVIPQALGAGSLAAMCLYYGALRGENPNV